MSATPSPENFGPAEAVLFGTWLRAYKQGPEAVAQLSHSDTDASITEAEVFALLGEFAEWDSVLPTYTDHLTIQYLAWRDLMVISRGGAL